MALPALSCAPAWADGDPASDWLASARPVFVPTDSGACAAQGAQLQRLVQRVNAAGYPIWVAVINSAGDLGTVTQLWKNPSGYSYYLRSELAYLWHGRVLAVMPQGEGLSEPTKQIPAGDARVMSNVTAPGSALVQAAFRTVSQLAAANGVSVSAGSAVSCGAGSGAGGGSALPWLVFAAGLVLIAGCWFASLRAKPLRRRVPA